MIKTKSLFHLITKLVSIEADYRYMGVKWSNSAKTRGQEELEPSAGFSRSSSFGKSSMGAKQRSSMGKSTASNANRARSSMSRSSNAFAAKCRKKSKERSDKRFNQQKNQVCCQ